MDNRLSIVQWDFQSINQSEDILELLSAYAMDIMGGGEDLSPQVKASLIPALKGRADSTIVLLAYVNEQAAGLAIAFEGFSTFYAKPLLNLHDFVVVEKFRGMGIARKMLERLEIIARERGYCKITLEVLTGNLRAQKVYKDFGFEAYSLDPDQGTAVFLNKSLI